MKFNRQSPVDFNMTPVETEIRNNWEVVLSYANQGAGPYLIDLSHISKWNFQGEEISKRQPAGLTIPQHHGHCSYQDKTLVGLVKWNWAMIWCFSEKDRGLSREKAFTDVTEAYAMMALVGKDIFSIMEKVTDMDLAVSRPTLPFLFLGPVLHVRSQVVVLETRKDLPAILIACARGYGQSMAEALLDSGEGLGLKPAGEKVFMEWLNGAGGPVNRK